MTESERGQHGACKLYFVRPAVGQRTSANPPQLFYIRVR